MEKSGQGRITMINLEQIQEPLQLCAKKAALLLLLVMISSSTLFAQDPTFSMIYLNKLFLNPAYTGINRDLNASAQTRIQWAGLPGRMETKTATMDVACPASKLGFGMMIYDDMAGDGAYRNTNGSVMIAAHLPSKYPRNLSWKRMRNRKFIMSAALQYTVGQKSVDWSRLVFSDQLDAALGILRPISAVQPGMETSNLIHDISAGLLFRTELNKNGSFWSVGVSSFHINQPVESFYGAETRLPTRLNIHSHVNFKVSKKYTNTIPTYLTMGLVYDKQAQMQTVLMGGSLTFGKDFLLGLWYRNRRVMVPEVDMDAIIVNLIYSTKTISVGYSYDITVSALGLDRTYGTHEIGINYRFDNVYLCKKKSRRGRADRNCFLVDHKFMQQNELINFLP